LESQGHRRTSIEDWNLRAIRNHTQIGDSERGQGGHQVLDDINVSSIMLDGSTIGNFPDEVNAQRNIHSEVAPKDAQSSALRGWFEPQG